MITSLPVCSMLRGDSCLRRFRKLPTALILPVPSPRRASNSCRWRRENEALSGMECPWPLQKPFDDGPFGNESRYRSVLCLWPRAFSSKPKTGATSGSVSTHPERLAEINGHGSAHPCNPGRHSCTYAVLSYLRYKKRRLEPQPFYDVKWNTT